MATTSTGLDEGQLFALADLLPALVWVCGPTGLCTYFNRRWLEFTGKTLDQEKGEGWVQGIHSEDLERCLKTYRTANEQRTPFEMKYRLRRGDGVYRWMLDQASPRFSQDQQFLGFIGICTDITSQAEAELQAHAERERLRVTLSSIGDGVIVTDATAQTVFLNSIAEELTGWKQTEARGQGIETVLRLVNEDTEAMVPNPACIAMTELRRVGLANHTIAIARDGTRRPIDDSAAPIFGPGGNLQGSVLVFRDVSERRRAEEMNRRLAAIVSTADDAIVGKTLDGIVTSWNAAAERLFGYSAQEMIGRSITTIIPPELLHEEDRILATLRKGEHIDHFETTRAAKDGRRVNVSITVSPIRDSSGRVIGASKIARDITAQRKGEEARSYLAAIVASSDDAIIGKNLDGIITSWNKGAERIFGYRPDEIIGRSILTLIPDDHQQEEQGILERIRRGERVDHFETVRQAKDGRLLDVSLTISPVKDGSGKIIGASKIARDITERKQIERQLREAQSQLQAHAQELEMQVQERTATLRATVVELEAFSYSVSHDLRAPLRAMQQYSEALLDEYASKLDSVGQQYLRRIVDSSTRMDKLITEVLAYSRIVRGRPQLHRVDIDRLLHEVIRNYPVLHSGQVTIDIPSPLHPVLANETFLTQCFSNLLVNAVKFVPRDKAPRILVWSELRNPEPAQCNPGVASPSTRSASPGVVRVWVQDNGIGIAPEHQERIFGMFERVYSESEYEGTGIGLAIVRKAVERMNGRVGVESNAGEGSRFWIELQAAPESAHKFAEQATAPAASAVPNHDPACRG